MNEEAEEKVKDFEGSEAEKGEKVKKETVSAEDDKDLNKSVNGINEKLKKAEEEIAVLKDTLLRKQADFENYRKRVIREKEETVKFGNTNLLLDLIGIIDDFERAINSADDSKDFDKFHKGIELIEKQFTSMLEKKWNLVRFDSSGEKFDPEKHEALMMEEKTGIEEPVVSDVFQNGYMLNSRVIRNAKVKVFMPVGKTDKTADQNNTADAEHNAENENEKLPGNQD